MHRTMLAAAFLSGLAGSPATSRAEGPTGVPEVLARHIHAGATLDPYLDEVLRSYVKATDPAVRPAWMADKAAVDEFAAANRREWRDFYARFDGDGDGMVTTAEVEATFRRGMEVGLTPPRERGLALMAREVMGADLDGDGSVTREEIDAFANRNTGDFPRPERDAWFALVPGGGDPGIEAVRAVAVRAFTGMDADGDGTISEDEIRHR